MLKNYRFRKGMHATIKHAKQLITTYFLQRHDCVVTLATKQMCFSFAKIRKLQRNCTKCYELEAANLKEHVLTAMI